jgi:glucokinase
MNFLGIEIGGTKLQVVAGRGSCMADRRRFAIDAKGGAAAIRDQIILVLPELMAKHAPVAIGVGFGGPVDWRRGRIGCSHHVEGWSDFPLADWLTEKTGLPAVVENDANAAAWAEAQEGENAGANPLFYITLGSGIGGGLVADGAIYHGAPPGEAEIGHLRLDGSGTTLESRCSGWAVDRRIREARAAHPQSLLFKKIGTETGGEARHLASAFALQDVLAKDIIRETAGDLAFALAHVAHLLHPEVIVLGGGLSLLGEPLRATIADALPSFLVEAFRPGPRIALSSLKEDAVPAGALLLAERAFSRGPNPAQKI